MKCELCFGWAESPESLPSMTRHIETFHQDIIPDQTVVWRDGEMVVVKEHDGEERLITVYAKKVEAFHAPEALDPQTLDEFES